MLALLPKVAGLCKAAGLPLFMMSIGLYPISTLKIKGKGPVENDDVPGDNFPHAVMNSDWLHH